MGREIRRGRLVGLFLLANCLPIVTENRWAGKAKENPSTVVEGGTVQYSSGNKIVVAERSASVITQNFSFSRFR